MTEKHEHKRDSETMEFEHHRADDGIPANAKWIADFVNRIGFPIFAFLVLAYAYFVQLNNNTRVIGELRDVMMAVKVSLDSRR